MVSSIEQHKKSTGDIGIGRLGDGTEQRDAIHFACAMVQAGHVLMPGSSVQMRDGKAWEVSQRNIQDRIGIVDPFLTKYVDTNQWFWLILNPGSITDLRHHWTHPAFDNELAIIKKSEEWLRAYCNTTEHSYEEFMSMLEWGSKPDNKYGYGFGSDPGIYDVPDEFWQHAETVLGKKLPNHTNYFRCAC
jgi:hypothetical protein